MHDAIAIALKFRACRGRRFGKTPPARLRRVRGVRREMRLERERRRHARRKLLFFVAHRLLRIVVLAAARADQTLAASVARTA
jgi:hypothetical protein